MPVLVDAFASIETVKAVSKRAVFCGTINGRSSCSSRSAVIGMQIKPRPCVAMKLIASGVIFSAAIVRSPSFSRSSSSTTITMRPARTASIACSMGAKGPLGLASLMERLDDILPNYVAFDVDAVARPERGERRVRHGVRHDLKSGVPVVQPRDREGNTVNRERAFLDDKARQLGRQVDDEPVVIAFARKHGDRADAVHVALDDVAAEASVSGERALEIDAHAGDKMAQRRHAQRRGRDIGEESVAGGIDGRETHAVDGNALARRQRAPEPRADAEAQTSADAIRAEHFADVFNQPGEHQPPAAYRLPREFRSGSTVVL